jgi:hypothetical protein
VSENAVRYRRAADAAEARGDVVGWRRAIRRWLVWAGHFPTIEVTKVFYARLSAHISQWNPVGSELHGGGDVGVMFMRRPIRWVIEAELPFALEKSETHCCA